MPAVPAQPASSPAAGGFALWTIGFRPLYLFAMVFSAISICCWVAQFAGWTGSHMVLAGPLWHAHEMLFGYAFAVIAGFLFTAVRNWTNRTTPSAPGLYMRPSPIPRLLSPSRPASPCRCSAAAIGGTTFSSH
jgi:uncharacterized protein involved in response to NO